MHNIRFIFRQKFKENKLDVHFKSDPICALQKLCIFRDWILPEYQFFEEDDS
jgi:hypothetical protein